MILHPLQERLDRLVAEVETRRVARASTPRRTKSTPSSARPDHALRLDRRRPDVLPDEPGAVDLDELVAALEQPHRAVHLRQEPRHILFPSPGLPRKTRCCVVATSVAPPPCVAPGRGNATNPRTCSLTVSKPQEGVELREQLLERPRRLLTPQHVDIELFADLGLSWSPSALQPLEGIRGHATSYPVVAILKFINGSA